MEAPTVDTITQNFDEWKAYHQHLGSIIDQADKLLHLERMTRHGQETIRELYERYVKPRYPAKIFDPSKVDSASDNRYAYDHDNVFISYFGRNTWVLDDLDYFVDKSVIVDGQCLLNVVKQ